MESQKEPEDKLTNVEKFTPSPTKLVRVRNKEGAVKLVPMNRAKRRRLKIK